MCNTSIKMLRVGTNAYKAVFEGYKGLASFNDVLTYTTVVQVQNETVVTIGKASLCLM